MCHNPARRPGPDVPCAASVCPRPGHKGPGLTATDRNAAAARLTYARHVRTHHHRNTAREGRRIGPRGYAAYGFCRRISGFRSRTSKHPEKLFRQPTSGRIDDRNAIEASSWRCSESRQKLVMSVYASALSLTRSFMPLFKISYD